MAREIREQPAAVERTIAHVRGRADVLAAEMRRREVRIVVLVARGTSDHAALYARYLLEARCGLLAALAAPSLYTVYRAPVDLRAALVLGVSQSGQVPEIVDSLEYARTRGALTAALTNDEGSPLAAAADHALVTRAGVEQSVAATKTFTTQLAAIAQLAASLGSPGLDGLGALGAAMSEAAEHGAAVGEAAERIRQHDAAACVARGFSYCIALEAALKLKEAAGVWAEGFSSADLRHGPAAAVGRLPAIVLHAGGPLAEDVAALEERLASSGSPVVSIGHGRELDVPQVSEELAPIVLAIPAQMLAERLARLRGLDPDAPPGLTKVTRT
jgi:glucosamine--fructose-6-phosphate aminotransferase (isomerizing)